MREEEAILQGHATHTGTEGSGVGVDRRDGDVVKP